MINILIDGDGYRACLVIDSVVHDTSSGGVRIADSVCLSEVQTLAREMTFKFTAMGASRGGAKMGVSIPSAVTPAEKARILMDLGRELGPIIRAGVYNPGLDMNCNADDLRAIYRGAGVSIGAISDSSYFTAIGVQSALEACYEHWECPGSISLAIEGFGRVAGHLAARLDPARFKIVAISTLSGAVRNREGFDLKALSSKRNEMGDDVVKHMAGETFDKEDVFSERVDILVPSSRTGVIHAGNVDGIRAKAVVPIANAPWAAGTVESLHARGVLCFPGYIANGGGIYGTALYDLARDIAEVETMTRRHVQPVMRRLLDLSRDLRIAPADLAQRAVMSQLQAGNRDSAPPGAPGLNGWLAKLLDRLRRYLPRTVRKAAARRKLVEGFAALERNLESAARSARAPDRAAGRESVFDKGKMDCQSVLQR